MGQGQRHGDLAVILFAQLAAVLARHADRVGSFLGKAGVVEDPGSDRPMPGQCRQHLLAHCREHSRIIPRGLGDEVMQGLVSCLDMPRIEAGGHRFDALALARQQQASAIAAQRIDPVGVTDLLGKSTYVSLEPDLTSGVGRNRQRLDHAVLYRDQLGSYNRLRDTVRLAACRT
jgi:hypothetical protein